MKEECRNCRYWKRCEHPSLESNGECRRFPPNCLLDQDGDHGFPLPIEGEWCGEYKEIAALKKEGEVAEPDYVLSDFACEEEGAPE